jgi:hypothetical protein
MKSGRKKGGETFKRDDEKSARAFAELERER